MKFSYAIRYLVNMSETYIMPELEDGEVLRIGDTVTLPMKQGASIVRKVEKIVPESEEDPIPVEMRKGSNCDFMIRDVDPDDLICEHSKSCSKRLTPFMEIRGGDLSIYESGGMVCYMLFCVV